MIEIKVNWSGIFRNIIIKSGITSTARTLYTTLLDFNCHSDIFNL